MATANRATYEPWDCKCLGCWICRMPHHEACLYIEEESKAGYWEKCRRERYMAGEKK